MYKQPDEPLIGQCEHIIIKGPSNMEECEHGMTQGLILVLFTMISKRSFWQIFNIIKKIVFRAFLYLNLLTVLALLNYY